MGDFGEAGTASDPEASTPGGEAGGESTASGVSAAAGAPGVPSGRAPMLDISAAAAATSPNPDRFLDASRLTFGSSKGTSSFNLARTASMLYGSFVRAGVALDSDKVTRLPAGTAVVVEATEQLPDKKTRYLLVEPVVGWVSRGAVARDGRSDLSGPP